jgi:hypothetical protein
MVFVNERATGVFEHAAVEVILWTITHTKFATSTMRLRFLYFERSMLTRSRRLSEETALS